MTSVYLLCGTEGSAEECHGRAAVPRSRAFSPSRSLSVIWPHRQPLRSAAAVDTRPPLIYRWQDAAAVYTAAGGRRRPAAGREKQAGCREVPDTRLLWRWDCLQTFWFESDLTRTRALAPEHVEVLGDVVSGFGHMPGKATSSVLPVQDVVETERLDAESFENIEGFFPPQNLIMINAVVSALLLFQIHRPALNWWVFFFFRDVKNDQSDPNATHAPNQAHWRFVSLDYTDVI